MNKKYQHWTLKEIRKLTRMNKWHVSIERMSKKLNRNEKSIILKLKALGVVLVNKKVRVYKSKKNPLGNIYHPDYQRA